MLDCESPFFNFINEKIRNNFVFTVYILSLVEQNTGSIFGSIVDKKNGKVILKAYVLILEAEQGYCFRKIDLIPSMSTLKRIQ